MSISKPLLQFASHTTSTHQQDRTLALVNLAPDIVTGILKALAHVSGWRYCIDTQPEFLHQKYDCVVTGGYKTGDMSGLNELPRITITSPDETSTNILSSGGVTISKDQLNASTLHGAVSQAIVEDTLKECQKRTSTQLFRILIVDADLQDVSTLTGLLHAASSDFTSTHVAGTAAAMQLLGQQAFDCVIVDYTLPDETGLVLLEALALSEVEVPAIMLTRNGSEAIAVEAIKKGADNYLVKFDFTAEQLDKVIRESIFQKRLASQVRAKDEELIRINRELASTNRFLDEVIDTMPGLFFVKDSQFRIIKANKQFLSLYPESVRHNVIGSTTVEEYPEEEAELFLADDKRAFELGFVDTQESIHFPDGSKRRLHTQKKRFTDVNGEDFVLGICSDETEREELISALQKSNTELAQFAYVASHDLKSPLQAINKLISWIDEDHAAAMPTEALEHFSLIKSRSQRMMSLLEDLLAYAQVHQKLDTEEPLALAEFAASVLEMNHRQDDFTLTVPDVTVCLPRFALQLVLLNLFSNSIKHHHQPTGMIDISIKQDKQGYQLIYRDDGPGIEPEYRQKVFQMFQTLRPRDEVEGSGMGLALVKKIIEHYSGTIQLVTPDNHQGIQAEIYWPVKNNILHREPVNDAV